LSGVDQHSSHSAGPLAVPKEAGKRFHAASFLINQNVFLIDVNALNALETES
jgi:hypothetical protein